ncbi:GIY-YIG nuclease family protein [Sphingobacterium paucimobilis]|nr:GIY-YIG nuclease family protein [Sphingobacterium paucimobilis]
MFTVYILYSVSIDRYYIGFTGNLVERLRRHNSYSKGYTGRAKDWAVVYEEAFADKFNSNESQEQ